MTPQLNNAQRLVLKNAVLADPVLGLLDFQGTADNDQAAADWLNVVGTFVVWKPIVTRHDIQVGTSEEGTTFDWASAGGYIARSQGERDAWREIFNSTGTVDPSAANVQAAFANIFSGAGAGAQACRAHIAAMSKRKATRAEQLLGTGTGTLVAPGKLTVAGPVSAGEAGQIMRGV